MLIKGILDEDTVNYKKLSMYIAFPYCTFKCDKENNCQLCQNLALIKQPNLEYSAKELVDHFINDTLSKAVVCCGLEPFDSFGDLLDLLVELRKQSDADFVVYTGYRKDEIEDKIQILQKFSNVIIKFGRFRPNEVPHFDEVLGVSLVNKEQYAEKIS